MDENFNGILVEVKDQLDRIEAIMKLLLCKKNPGSKTVVSSELIQKIALWMKPNIPYKRNEICLQFSISHSDWLKVSQALLDERIVTKEGYKRSTQYYLYQDNNYSEPEQDNPPEEHLEETQPKNIYALIEGVCDKLRSQKKYTEAKEFQTQALSDVSDYDLVVKLQKKYLEA
jgi:hypothetical protein